MDSLDTRSWCAALLAGFLSCIAAEVALAGPIHMRPYLGADKSELILVWDEATGLSRSWYYDTAAKRFTPAAPRFQLPPNPGVTRDVLMAPYLGPDGSEVVLVWDKKIGRSVSWYYDQAGGAFFQAPAHYQLPPQAGKEVWLAPYLDRDGSEVVLVWDAATGKSRSWYFSKEEQKFVLAEPGYQLPENLGLQPPVMLRPYLTAAGDETIHAWSRSSGQSQNWFFAEDTQRYQRSPEGYQIPPDPGMGKDIWMSPYLDKQGGEIMLVWSAVSGRSVNWYFDAQAKKFLTSAPEYQLPANPLKTDRLMLVPYVDPKSVEVILMYDAKAGASRSFYLDDGVKRMVPAPDGFQLPADPLK